MKITFAVMVYTHIRSQRQISLSINSEHLLNLGNPLNLLYLVTFHIYSSLQLLIEHAAIEKKENTRAILVQAV